MKMKTMIDVLPYTAPIPNREVVLPGFGKKFQHFVPSISLTISMAITLLNVCK